MLAHGIGDAQRPLTMNTISKEILEQVTGGYGGHGEWDVKDGCQWHGIQEGGRMVDRFFPNASDAVRKQEFLKFRDAAEASCRARQGG